MLSSLLEDGHEDRYTGKCLVNKLGWHIFLGSTSLHMSKVHTESHKNGSMRILGWSRLKWK